MEYFPDYTEKQRPDREYLFSVLATTRYEQLKSMVENSRKQRAKENDLSEDEFIYVDKNILSEIEEVMAQKSKYLSFNPNLATKGSANYLLRKCAKLKRNRKLPKKYIVQVSNFMRSSDREEKKEEDSME